MDEGQRVAGDGGGESREGRVSVEFGEVYIKSRSSVAETVGIVIKNVIKNKKESPIGNNCAIGGNCA